MSPFLSLFFPLVPDEDVIKRWAASSGFSGKSVAELCKVNQQ
jgi:hypothetical protein